MDERLCARWRDSARVCVCGRARAGVCVCVREVAPLLLFSTADISQRDLRLSGYVSLKRCPLQKKSGAFSNSSQIGASRVVIISKMFGFDNERFETL